MAEKTIKYLETDFGKTHDRLISKLNWIKDYKKDAEDC